MDAGERQTYSLGVERKAYLIQIEGSGSVNENPLEEKDAAEITEEETVTLTARTSSHYILFDLAC